MMNQGGAGCYRHHCPYSAGPGATKGIEKSCHLAGKGCRFLPGGKVTATFHNRPADDVEIQLRHPARERRDDFARKGGKTGGQIDAILGWFLGAGAVIEPEGRDDGIVDQGNHDLRQHLIFAEPLLDVAACTGPGVEFFQYPGGVGQGAAGLRQADGLRFILL